MSLLLLLLLLLFTLLFTLPFVHCILFSFVGYPGNYNYIGTVRLDECPTYGCFLELTIQLVIILLGKQILNNCVELGVPIVKYIIKRIRNWRSGEDQSTAVYTRWEKDFDLPDQDKFGLLPEYLELVIQYGFITIFVAILPSGAILCTLKQLGGDQVGRLQVHCYGPACSQRKSTRHWVLVRTPGFCLKACHRLQCEFS